MDTDSFIHETTDNDIYKVMKENINEFDTSDYTKNNQFDIPRANKKVLGLIKVCCRMHLSFIHNKLIYFISFYICRMNVDLTY